MSKESYLFMYVDMLLSVIFKHFESTSSPEFVNISVNTDTGVDRMLESRYLLVTTLHPNAALLEYPTIMNSVTVLSSKWWTCKQTPDL